MWELACRRVVHAPGTTGADRTLTRGRRKTRLCAISRRCYKSLPKMSKVKPVAGVCQNMRLTPDRVVSEYEWVRGRANVVVPLLNDVRADLGDLFEADVDRITEEAYLSEVDAVFADGDRALNLATLVALLRELDVDGDYPGFVVDELLGRELAGMIAGTQPLRLLGEATFHYADVHTHADDLPAGADDLDAALAAGFQTRLPGWDWQETASPFAIGEEDVNEQ
jgi:hypothetical protein